MGIFSAIYRYVVTLGGLIGGDIDGQTDKMLATPSGIKATFAKTRENWTEQYAQVREAVAQLMMVLEQKKNNVDKLQKEAADLKVKMNGAVERFKATNDVKYKEAFGKLHARDQELQVEQERLNGEIQELHGKVGEYKKQLAEMQGRIQELKNQESQAIADIVSSQQIIRLNDRLSNLSTELDDKNLEAIESRRQNLVASAKLSGDLRKTDGAATDLDAELMSAGLSSDADDLFSAMVAEGQSPEAEVAAPEKQREI